MKKISKKSKIFLLLGILFIPVFIFSFIFTTKIKASNLVSLEQEQVVEKTYFASGEFLNIRGTINGDAFLAGSDITFSGNINGNLFVAGNTVTLTGKVKGNIFSAGNVLTINSEGAENIYVAGNLININSKINKNLYAAGNSITISKNSGIGSDLFVSGSTVNLNADVVRDASIGSSMITMNSNIGRDASLISNTINFGDDTSIGQNLEILDNTKTQSNLNNLVKGNITIKISEKIDKKANYINSFKSKVIRKLTFGLFSVLVVGFLFIKFLNKLIIKINKDSENNFGKNLGKGVLFLLGVPFISILLLITIIGIKLSFIAIGIYVMCVFFASVFSSIFIGNLFLNKLMKQKTPSLYLSLLIGSLIFIILTIIPFIGWMIGSLIIAVSIGSLINLKSETMKILNKKS